MSFLNDLGIIFIQYGIVGLFVMSFAESSFFPIPPDVVLIPLCLMDPELALVYAGLTTLASVLGGLFGYYLGQKLGRPLLHKMFSSKRLDRVEEMFVRYGGWSVAVAAFTPIPYKIFTITAGVCRVRRSTFILASTLGRGGRFFLVAITIILFGERAETMIAQYLGPVSFAIVAVIILAYVLYLARHRAGFLFQTGAKIRSKILDLMQHRYARFGDASTRILIAGSIAVITGAFVLTELVNILLSGHYYGAPTGRLTGLFAGTGIYAVAFYLIFFSMIGFWMLQRYKRKIEVTVLFICSAGAVLIAYAIWQLTGESTKAMLPPGSDWTYLALTILHYSAWAYCFYAMIVARILPNVYAVRGVFMGLIFVAGYIFNLAYGPGIFLAGILASACWIIGCVSATRPLSAKEKIEPPLEKESSE